MHNFFDEHLHTCSLVQVTLDKYMVFKWGKCIKKLDDQFRDLV